MKIIDKYYTIILYILQYCNNLPLVKTISKMDYEQMLTDKDTVTTLNQSVAYMSSTGVELSLNDKYQHFHYNVAKFI